MRFEWGPVKASKNLLKHGVSFPEALDVFEDEFAIDIFDVAHSDDEPRFKRLGTTGAGILLVIYTERVGNVVRIISARKASRNERRTYEKERKNRLQQHP